jgi:hypothetical protein
VKSTTVAGIQAMASRLRPVPVVFFLLAFLLNQSLAWAADPWPTLQFKVFAGNPFALETDFEVDWVEMEDLYGGISDSTRQNIEEAMHQAAVWYQERGFPAPVIDDMDDTDNGEAYRVYVCSRDWDQAAVDYIFNAGFVLPNAEWEQCGYNPVTQTSDIAYYRPDCPQVTDRSKFIVINADAALNANGKLTELGYQSLAHELMHAIMAKTELVQSDPECKMGKWIGEGIPDAIGWDIAEDLWQNRYTPSNRNSDVGKRWGTRPYHLQLPQADDYEIAPGVELDIGYRTSSFWRFLADADPRGWKLLISDDPAKPGFLDQPLEGDPGWRTEVKWLDKALRKRFNYGLNAMYASFIGWFAYSIAPYTKYQHAGSFESVEDWMVEDWTKTLYGPCYPVDLSAEMQQSVALPLRRLGTRCLWLEPVGIAGGIQITFQAEHTDSRLLDDIWISKPGTTLQVRASNVGELPDATQGFIATWKDFPQDGSEWGLYLITNVAQNPGETLHRDFNLKISRGSNTNSARNALPPRKHVPTPGQPSHEKHAKTLNRQRSETQKMINEQINEDKNALSEHVAAANLVSRQPNGFNCREPFVYQPCGPQMSINLSVRPGTYIAPGQSSTGGGMAAQMMGGFSAMAQTSTFDTQSVVTELDAKLKAMDGSGVSIRTPMFDYGFSGAFDSAQITVTMKDEKQLSAIGPPNAEGWSRLTGKVTIEEYTPYILRGSFVAPLAEIVEGPNGEGVYTRRETVTGTFTSVAPWQHDERVRIVYDSEEVMRQDIINALGVPAGIANALEEDGAAAAAGAAAQSGAAGGPSTGGGMLGGDCSCECEDRDAADELCEFFCEEEFAACDSP